MRITMLGTSAAFADPERAQSGILVTLDNGRHYLFDCGAGITRNMVRANVSPSEVTAVFLTHMHHDHICDFPLFVITGWMWNREDSPIVIGPKGTNHFCKSLFEGGAFKADFEARSSYPLRQKNLAAVRPKVIECEPGIAYQDEHVTIHCDWVEHIPRQISECFGIRLEAEGKAIAFSGDTAPCDAMVRLAQDTDLLIHECTFPDSFLEHRKKTGVGTFAHTSPTELGKIATRSGTKRLVATHFANFHSTAVLPLVKRVSGAHYVLEDIGPHQMDAVARDIRRHYSGPVQLASDMLRIDL